MHVPESVTIVGGTPQVSKTIASLIRLLSCGGVTASEARARVAESVPIMHPLLDRDTGLSRDPARKCRCRRPRHGRCRRSNLDARSLEDIQKYVRHSDTGGWEAFWHQTVPKIENTCTDRLLDLLRPRLPGAIELFLELPMPDQNRVDIYASLLGQGLPIEIKGQWHPELWSASGTQLNEKYSRDWRTGGRGIYLVF
jgi:hypothetical protein